MVLCPMKNANSPMTHFAAALLGAAMATTLLANEPLGLSLTPRMETMYMGIASVQDRSTTLSTSMYVSASELYSTT